MSTVAFDASIVAAQDQDEGVILVGFADHPSDPTRYLLLQRTTHPTPQDTALGHDTYHMEWCGQENSGYGGIAQFKLREGSAHITFTDARASEIGGVTAIAITFSLSPAELLRLRETLLAVFNGCDCLVIAPEA